MSVKYIKIAAAGDMQINEVPKESDWVPPGTNVTGSREVVGAPLFAATLVVGNGTADYTISLSVKARIKFCTHNYTGVGHAGDAFLLKDSGAAAICGIPAGSATAGALLYASVNSTANQVVAAEEVLTLSVTDGGGDPSGLFTIYYQPEA